MRISRSCHVASAARLPWSVCTCCCFQGYELSRNDNLHYSIQDDSNSEASDCNICSTVAMQPPPPPPLPSLFLHHICHFWRQGKERWKRFKKQNLHKTYFCAGYLFTTLASNNTYWRINMGVEPHAAHATHTIESSLCHSRLGIANLHE